MSPKLTSEKCVVCEWVVKIKLFTVGEKQTEMRPANGGAKGQITVGEGGGYQTACFGA